MTRGLSMLDGAAPSVVAVAAASFFLVAAVVFVVAPSVAVVAAAFVLVAAVAFAVVVVVVAAVVVVVLSFFDLVFFNVTVVAVGVVFFFDITVEAVGVVKLEGNFRFLLPSMLFCTTHHIYKQSTPQHVPFPYTCWTNTQAARRLAVCIICPTTNHAHSQDTEVGGKRKRAISYSYNP